MVGVEAHPDAARVVHHAERHAAVHGGLELEEHLQVEPGFVEGPDPPEHVGVSSAEVLGDEAGWHAFERGEVEAAGEVVVEFGITRPPGIVGGGGDGEGAQGVLHRAPPGEEALVGGVVLRAGGPGGFVGRLGHRSGVVPSWRAGLRTGSRWPDRRVLRWRARKVGPRAGRWDGWMGLVERGGKTTGLGSAATLFAAAPLESRPRLYVRLTHPIATQRIPPILRFGVTRLQGKFLWVWEMRNQQQCEQSSEGAQRNHVLFEF